MYTFKLKRKTISNKLIKDILDNNNFIEKDDNVHISDNTLLKSNLYTCSNGSIIIFNNKLEMYKFLSYFKFIPKTFIIKNGKWLGKELDEENKIIFLKECNIEKGKGIFLFNIKKDIEIFSKKDNITYIVQPNIDNILLYNNRKIDFRIFTIFGKFDNKIFIRIFKKGIGRLSELNYDSDKLDKKVHICNTTYSNSLSYKNKVVDFDKNFKDYSILIKKIIKCIYYVIKNNYYHLIDDNNMCCKLGWDFIFDNKYKIFLLEINNNPYINKDYHIHKEFINCYTNYTLIPLTIEKNIKKYKYLYDIYMT